MNIGYLLPINCVLPKGVLTLEHFAMIRKSYQITCSQLQNSKMTQSRPHQARLIPIKTCAFAPKSLLIKTHAGPFVKSYLWECEVMSHKSQEKAVKEVQIATRYTLIWLQPDTCKACTLQLLYHKKTMVITLSLILCYKFSQAT